MNVCRCLVLMENIVQIQLDHSFATVPHRCDGTRQSIDASPKKHAEAKWSLIAPRKPIASQIRIQREDLRVLADVEADMKVTVRPAPTSMNALEIWTIAAKSRNATTSLDLSNADAWPATSRCNQNFALVFSLYSIVLLVLVLLCWCQFWPK